MDYAQRRRNGGNVRERHGLRRETITPSFFHKAANMRRRINHIGVLHDGEQVLEAQANIESCLVSHFTAAFKKDRHRIPEWVDEDLKKVPDHLWPDLVVPFSSDEMAEVDGWIEGLSICVGGPSTSHVQYADDAVILCAAKSLSIRGVKFVCKCFEFLSGLRINFQKSSMLGTHLVLEDLASFARRFSCRVQQFPTHLLGLPLHLIKLLKMDWNPLVVKFERRLEGWKGKLLSFGGRLTLLQAVLSNLPVFFMSIFKVPVGVLQKLEGLRRRFLWSRVHGEGCKSHLVRWDLVCSRRYLGGAGVSHLGDLNKALLSKWRWRWLSNRRLLWCRLLETRFGDGVPTNPFSAISPRVSFTWWNILSAIEGFLDAIQWKVGDGRTIRFWHDVWLRDSLLKEQFAEGVQDEVLWRPQPRLSFSVRGCYNWWRRDLPRFETTALEAKEIWRPKIPLKEKLLTRVYRAKWVFDADTQCPLCEMEEKTVLHLFIDCPFARQLWQLLKGAIEMEDQFSSLTELWEAGSAIYIVLSKHVDFIIIYGVLYEKPIFEESKTEEILTGRDVDAGR
ncbi:hypothetical protein QJS04_geneDACA023754 [Acorus gramineus]|uniref:Reverse transcriptase zinc-binding domain-containing protein n=1 Tax=Acorus gramineus TaxID=55184 RepID=A0AAV9BNV8_ACOGR|nr:hypothetical protein QJS04_geneDACA023754 [Acorus gramineus]